MPLEIYLSSFKIYQVSEEILSTDQKKSYQLIDSDGTPDKNHSYIELTLFIYKKRRKLHRFYGPFFIDHPCYPRNPRP